MENIAPLIAVVGETASGKSALALEIARKFNGEIIAADSRTIYTSMDIGTAKPSRADQSQVPHFGLDIVQPTERYTVYDFQKYAQQAIVDIAVRGKVPILVGGTGLYVDSVLFNYTFSEGGVNESLRMRLQQKTIDELQEILRDRNIPLPTNAKNKRHLVRQIETGGVVRAQSLRENTLVLGILLKPEQLKRNVIARVDQMLAAGLEDEVGRLVAMYGWDCEPMKGIGYREFRELHDGVRSIQQVRELIIQNTMQLAKRQRTWFRRNKSIHWIEKEEYVDLVTTFLNK